MCKRDSIIFRYLPIMSIKIINLFFCVFDTRKEQKMKTKKQTQENEKRGDVFDA